MSNWNKVFKPIVVLCAICVVVTAALAATNQATAPVIAAATAEAQRQARMEPVSYTHLAEQEHFYVGIFGLGFKVGKVDFVMILFQNQVAAHQ